MNQSFKLKGSLFTLSVLQLLSPDLDQFAKDLEVRVKMAPKFFNFTPMVIDLQALNIDHNFDFTKLKNILALHDVIPVGIRGLPEALVEDAKAAHLALMHESSSAPKIEIPPEEDTNAHGAELLAGTKVIETPVRGDQRIYAQNGDLIIIGSVSRGAELLADGNIHVYGILRGRALAGVNGNKEARIFCQQLAAEMVSIAGQHQLFENIDQLTQRPTQVYLNALGELIVAKI
jgi:septum site-determining protein MinC